MFQDLAKLAERALDTGDEAVAIPQLTQHLATYPGDPALWHWLALLHRGLDDRISAIAALEQARRRAPGDAALVHALARVRMEAGLPAVAEFAEAIRLAPTRPEYRLGLAAARLADGDGVRALEELSAMLAANPGWYEGHRQFAQLVALVGRSDQAFSTYEAALIRFPDAGQLHFDAAALLVEASDWQQARQWLDRALDAVGDDPALLQLRAGVLDELGLTEDAEREFARLPAADDDAAQAVRRQRFLLRRGEGSAAATALEPWLASGAMAGLWPYAALAWRLAGDRRWGWLEREDFVATIEIDPDLVDCSALAAVLRKLHAKSGRFLDQSVRHGTQTDGHLLARTEPAIATLREALREAIANHTASLSADEAGHPLLGRKPGPRPRFAGSWSVRLSDAGFHAAHHHPQGWYSSAFYVSVPSGSSAGEGLLEVGGSPADLGLNLAPLHVIEPKPGRLALFPSTMWHCTTPFAAGERMTVAFDILPGA